MEQKQTIIVNLFGGAGSGKSRNRAKAFAKMKDAGWNVEEVVEWIKYKVYEESSYVRKDQPYVFHKQRKWLLTVSKHVDVIITDSPLLLSCYYEDAKNSDRLQYYLSEFNKFNNLNIFIERDNPYNPVGRYQTEEEAKRDDVLIKQMLDVYNIPYVSILGNKKCGEEIFELVESILNEYKGRD